MDFLLSLFSFLPSVNLKKAVGIAVLTCKVGCMDGSADKGKTAKEGWCLDMIVHGRPVFPSPFVF